MVSTIAAVAAAVVAVLEATNPPDRAGSGDATEVAPGVTQFPNPRVPDAGAEAAADNEAAA